MRGRPERAEAADLVSARRGSWRAGAEEGVAGGIEGSAEAVIDARTLSGLPGEADRIDLQSLLEEGGSVTLTYDPGQSGRCDEQGDMVDEPIDPAFVATALGWGGAVIGSGSGTTIAEAMLRVYRRQAPLPDLGDSGTYSDEPPF